MHHDEAALQIKPAPLSHHFKPSVEPAPLPARGATWSISAHRCTPECLLLRKRNSPCAASEYHVVRAG